MIFGSNPYMDCEKNSSNMCQMAKHAKVVRKSRGGLYKVVALGHVEMFQGSLSNGILSHNATGNPGIFLISCSLTELMIEDQLTSSYSLKVISSSEKSFDAIEDIQNTYGNCSESMDYLTLMTEEIDESSLVQYSTE